MVQFLKNAALGVSATAGIITVLPFFGAAGFISAAGAGVAGVIGIGAAIADKFSGD
jgi:hypothetical protein